MKLPTPLATALVTLIGGLVLVSGEVRMAHPLHQAIVVVATFVAGLLVHPGEASVASTTAPAPAPQQAVPPPGI